jgi:fructosamine-3-kinase
VDITLVDRAVARIADGVMGGAEPPARIHGDLWPGNVVWADDRAWIVDPAAHGGHRETDLAHLALFGGAPFQDRVVAAYDEEWPLAPGWRERIAVHQLHLMLVHAAMLGAAYRDDVMKRAAAVA